jgi:ATP-dependent RNA helicase HelY
MALTPDRGVVRLGAADFAGPVVPVGAIELPRPYAPRSPAFRRAVAEALRTARIRPGGRDGQHGDGPGASRTSERDELARHPVASCPDLADHLRWADRADRLARDTERLERRIRGRTESLARQFDRVLRVLEAWGYVDGWNLTEAGALLARLYAETDLLVAESVREGLLDHLSPAAMAAVCSCFTYETRGPGVEPAGLSRGRFPSRVVRDRVAEVERIWRDLHVVEDEAGLPETRPPDAGFAPYAYGWAAGRELEEVLGDDEMTGGDFVRNVKQLIDLLRQVADVAPAPETAEVARAAAEAMFRGVVAASSTVGPTS